jgi:hypothetical protein
VKTLTGSGRDGVKDTFFRPRTAIDLHVSALTKGGRA